MGFILKKRKDKKTVKRFLIKKPGRVDFKTYDLFQGDCLDVLKKYPENSIDSLVCDPPAGINFMNKKWDGDKGGRDVWVDWLTETSKEILRVLKPGSYGLVWALPRTSHWTATGLENAGFEIRDIILHLFGSGFPKSRDVWKSDIQKDLNQLLKDQGIEGEINWK